MKYDIPEGKWRHICKSFEWEQNNGNPAKGLVGTFTQDGPYLRWQSEDGQENMFIEVIDIEVSDVGSQRRVYIKHRSGLQYFFKKAEEQNGTKGKIGGRNPSHGNGQGNKKSHARRSP